MRSINMYGHYSQKLFTKNLPVTHAAMLKGLKFYTNVLSCMLQSSYKYSPHLRKATGNTPETYISGIHPYCQLYHKHHQISFSFPC